MIEPSTGAEQLYTRNLAAYRVRAIRAATAGEPYAYLDEAFREAVKRVGRTFESRNDGLVEWAELLAKEVLAGKAVPGVDALVLDAAAIAADEAELATLAAGGLPVEEPEPEKKEEPKTEKKPEAKTEKTAGTTTTTTTTAPAKKAESTTTTTTTAPAKKAESTTSTTTTAPAKTGSAQKTSDDWYTMSSEKKKAT